MKIDSEYRLEKANNFYKNNITKMLQKHYENYWQPVQKHVILLIDMF